MPTASTREPLLSSGTFREIKEIYEKSGELFYSETGKPPLTAVKPVNNFEGYSFTEFLEYFQTLNQKIGASFSKTSGRSFPKVFFIYYLARFSVLGTVPFNQIKSIVAGIPDPPKASASIDLQKIKTLVFDLNTIVENAILTLESDKKYESQNSAVSYLLDTAFPAMFSEFDKYSDDETIQKIKTKFVKLSEYIKLYNNNKTTYGPKVLVDHNIYVPGTTGREIKLTRGSNSHMFLEKQQPVLILSFLQEKINNDILLPFSDLNAEIKILKKFQHYDKLAQSNKITPNQKYKYNTLKKIVTRFNISESSLVEKSYKMYSQFIPLLGVETSKEKFLLLNRFIINKKGESERSPVIKNVLFPVEINGSVKLVSQSGIYTKEKTTVAGSSFESLFKQKLLSALGGVPKKLIIEDSAGFVTRAGTVDPNGVLLTSEMDTEEARKNAHADIYIPCEDGKDLWFSLKADTFGYLSGTNLERGKSRMKHAEIMASPLGKKWYSDISQFNADVGAIFAAATPEILERTKDSQQKIVDEFCAFVEKESGFKISEILKAFTVESLQVYAKDMVQSAEHEEINTVVKQILGKIKSLRESQSLGVKGHVSDLEKILIKTPFRLWRMIYEQTLETKAIFGEERESVKAGLGFENVSHIIVDMPLIEDKGDRVVITQDQTNKEQFVIANKNFKMITPVQSPEAAVNSNAAIVKYAEFFKRALPVMISRKQGAGAKNAKKYLDIVGLGNEIVPIKELDQKGEVLNTGPVQSAFDDLIKAGQEQNKNKYIAGLQSLSNTLNESFKQNPNNSLIRFEAGQALDKENLILRVNDMWAESFKINLTIALVLKDSRVDLGKVMISINNKNAAKVQQAIVEMIGLVKSDEKFMILENVLVPKIDMPQTEKPQFSSDFVRSLVEDVANKAEPVLKKEFMNIGERVAKVHIEALNRLGIKEKFTYKATAAIDKAAVMRYLMTVVS